jgi:uncharacterized protein
MISDWPSWEAQFFSFMRDSAQSADVAHDLEHIRRVVGNARAIAAAEGGLLEVVVPAAWLHDCIVLPKDSGERASASRLVAEVATAFLKEIEYPRPNTWPASPTPSKRASSRTKIAWMPSARLALPAA